MESRNGPFRKFLAYHPASSFVTTNVQRIFLQADGRPSFESWAKHGAESPDLRSLFLIGEKAFDFIPELRTLEGMNEGLAAYHKFVDEVAELLVKLLEAGTLKARDEGGAQITDPSVIERMESSEIVNIAWSIFTNKNEFSLDVPRDTFLFAFTFSVLEEIDNALVGIHMDGRAAIASALAASESYANAIAIISKDDRLQSARKVLSAQAAASRHLNDPKQREKQFVQDCWRDWRDGIREYKNKAAFARDMIAKCEHLLSVRKIEDWVRDWDKERATARDTPMDD